MKKFGLLGEKLSHSFSPLIHGMLADYSYTLIERKPEELEELFAKGEYDGFNVTIPYKKAVIPYMTELSDVAKRCDSINTVVRRADGTYYGDNTDYYGFRMTVEQSGVAVSGKKVLVLGDGGVASTVRVVLADLGADPIVTISRRGENNYTNLDLHEDAEVIVNTTPVGMYPECGKSPVNLDVFPKLCGVFDLIFNPLQTEILLSAKERNIPAFGGLLMLVKQAICASEKFIDCTYDDEKTAEIERHIRVMQSDIFLIGMPGCGKSSVGRKLAELTGRELLDTDQLITEKHGRAPGDIIVEDGESAFRKIETEALREVASMSGKIIATGGGIVTIPENLRLMQQNGIIIFIDRSIDKLSKKGRPLSGNVEKLAEIRMPLYKSWCQYTVSGDTVEEKALKIKEIIERAE